MSDNPSLLADIEAFLADTGMGASYFGKVAAKNSELVPRLRGEKPGKRRVWPETEAEVRAFMAKHRETKRAPHEPAPADSGQAA